MFNFKYINNDQWLMLGNVDEFREINKNNCNTLENIKFKLEFKISLLDKLWSISLYSNLLDRPLYIKSGNETKLFKTEQYRPMTRDEIIDSVFNGNLDPYKLYRFNTKTLYNSISDPVTSYAIIETLLNLNIFNKDEINFIVRFESLDLKYIDSKLTPVGIISGDDVFKYNISLYKSNETDYENYIGNVILDISHILNNKELFNNEYIGKKNGVNYYFRFTPTKEFKEYILSIKDLLNKELRYISQFI